MGNKKNKWILLATFVVLFLIVFTPLHRLSYFGVYRSAELEPNEILSIDEINDFMKVWSKFLISDASRLMGRTSLSQGNEIPSQVSRWVATQGWEAKRFFAVERRLRELVNISNLQNNLASNIQMQNKTSGGNLRAIIEMQEKTLAAAKYNQQELDIVVANLYQISQVLDGKAIMK